MAWREELTVGALTVEKPLTLPSYTLALAPDAALWPSAIIFMSDATPPNVAVSDGTNWIATDDGGTSA